MTVPSQHLLRQTGGNHKNVSQNIRFPAPEYEEFLGSMYEQPTSTAISRLYHKNDTAATSST
jgi:hypothetical protein